MAMSDPGPARDDDCDYDMDAPHPDCWCDGDGMIVVCIDDCCRGSGGCGRYDDYTCYAVCPCGWLVMVLISWELLRETKDVLRQDA